MHSSPIFCQDHPDHHVLRVPNICHFAVEEGEDLKRPRLELCRVFEENSHHMCFPFLQIQQKINLLTWSEYFIDKYHEVC